MHNEVESEIIAKLHRWGQIAGIDCQGDWKPPGSELPGALAIFRFSLFRSRQERSIAGCGTVLREHAQAAEAR